MPSMDPFGPLAPPLSHPVKVSDAEAFVITPAISRADGERIGRAAILERTFRPGDIDKAEIAPAVAVYAPIWRLDVAADGFHVGVASVGKGRGIGGMIPTGGARSADRVVLVPARRFLCFDPTEKLEIPREQMVPRSSVKLASASVIDPDVTRADAEAEAKARLVREVSPSSALYASYEARVRAAALCMYPVWLLRYRYRGEATTDAGGEACHVAVSARTGKVVSARHPSAWRSVAGRIKGWFS